MSPFSSQVTRPFFSVPISVDAISSVEISVIDKADCQTSLIKSSKDVHSAIFFRKSQKSDIIVIVSVNIRVIVENGNSDESRRFAGINDFRVFGSFPADHTVIIRPVAVSKKWSFCSRC